jgi:hypothetical protein
MGRDRESKLTFLGQFEHFLYVGKIALAGWAFHYRMPPFSLGRQV